MAQGIKQLWCVRPWGQEFRFPESPGKCGCCLKFQNLGRRDRIFRVSRLAGLAETDQLQGQLETLHS